MDRSVYRISPVDRSRGNRSFVIPLIVCMIMIPPSEADAQACCSSGTPLLSVVELGTGKPQILRLSLRYDFNFLNSVFNGSEAFPNDAGRQRRVHSLVVEGSYGISSRISLSSLFSFTQRERRSTIIESGETETVQTRGLSDAILMMKYSIVIPTIVSQWELAVGTGLKIPTGSIDAAPNGIRLSSDMQPGSGSWDGIFWIFGSASFHPLPVSSFFSLTHRATGVNRDGYEFGNDIQSTVGGSYSLSPIIDLTLYSRYRHQATDLRLGDSVPNTGGSWLDVIPGINVTPVPLVTIRFHLDVPVYRDLTGSQLTTTVVSGVNVFYGISFE